MQTVCQIVWSTLSNSLREVKDRWERTDRQTVFFLDAAVRTHYLGRPSTQPQPSRLMNIDAAIEAGHGETTSRGGEDVPLQTSYQGEANSDGVEEAGSDGEGAHLTTEWSNGEDQGRQGGGREEDEEEEIATTLTATTSGSTAHSQLFKRPEKNSEAAPSREPAIRTRVRCVSGAVSSTGRTQQKAKLP